jgi:hypothetical protein
MYKRGILMIEGYKKLINDLNMHKRFKDAFQNEYEYNQRLFHKHASTSMAIKSLDRVVDDLRYYENLIYIENENIIRLEAKIKAIDECINQSDVTVKVAQLRALGMTQESVAELVGIGDRHVRRIEAKLREEII